MNTERTHINLDGVVFTPEQEMALQKTLSFIFEICPEAFVKLICLQKNKVTEALFSCSMDPSTKGRSAISFYESGGSPGEMLKRIEKRVKKEWLLYKKTEAAVNVSRGERFRPLNMDVAI